MKLSLLPDAKMDALESIVSFNQLSPGLGEQFEDELFACFDRIKGDPDHYAENEDGFRASRLSRFRAVVYFRLHENEIFVVRILVNGRSQVPNSGG
jgi:plasmid stabilization system protein ParE